MKDGLNKVADGLSKVCWMVLARFDGLSKVLDGLGKVSDGLCKVLDGLG